MNLTHGFLSEEGEIEIEIVTPNALLNNNSNTKDIQPK